MICCFRRTAHIAARLYIPVIWPAAVVFCFSQNSPFVNSFMDIHACRRFGMKVSSAKRFYVLNFTTVRNMQSRWPLRLPNAVRREYSVVFDFVTCVPLSAKGRRKRGYNQAALLAKQTALHLHLPYKATLIKIRENTAQHSLPKAMRWENVQGVYAPRRKTLLNGKSVLLIDDIVTTGNTLRECAHVLEKSGATVWCATLASVE